MWIELDDEVWPERKTLTGCIFAADADWERTLALLPGESWELYHERYPQWRMLVVRKRRRSAGATPAWPTRSTSRWTTPTCRPR